jgi:hypothetical protein
MTKDKLTVAFALFMQFAAIIWWASQLNTGVSNLERQRQEMSMRLSKIEDTLGALSMQVSRITSIVEREYDHN